MLTHLAINNFTIIDQLELNLQPGMTVLTGETGAGKSIIIDTLELVLGARTDSTIIRANAERCEITACFDINNITGAKKWLEQHDLTSDTECIIRRSITPDGRSRSSINGTPCPQQLTRELGSLLLNIHGQHEHQSLLKTDKQRDLLDNFTGNQQLCQQVKTIYNQWQQANNQRRELEALTLDQPAKIELLNYQVKELDELELQANELEELHQEHKQLSNAEEILTTCQTALELLTANPLVNVAQQLATIKAMDNTIDPAHELVHNAIIQTDEAAYELRHYLDKADLHPERLATVEQRLNTIYNLARKHQIQPEQLFDLQQKLTKELQQLTAASSELNTLEEQIAALSDQYQQTATKLTQIRQKAAKKLSALISAKMQQLNMAQATFALNFSPNKNGGFSASGMEQVEFLVATNPGHAPQPLTKVASGGELSRISLAIQVITAGQYTTPTLIFDEVDVGIGGKTAAIVGQLLSDLSTKTQILCVTHLPQVAAHGTHHLQVSKQNTKQSTHAKITSLNGNNRIEEIARMLGGLKITAQTLAHAKEMCENTKNRLN